MDAKKPFETIVAEHSVTVLRVCRAVLGTHPDADDAWSETFLAALRAYPDLPSNANVQAWLVTIAHRKAIDVTRARGRAPLTVEELPEPASRIGLPGNDETDLWAAVARLPPRQRQAVAYHYFGGLRYQEIATLSGGTAAAIRRAASDGVASLRRSFATQSTAPVPAPAPAPAAAAPTSPSPRSSHNRKGGHS